MRQSLIILDDILPGIDRLRDIALSQDYPAPPAGVYYPGRNSARPIEIKGLHQQIEAVIGEQLVPMPSDSNAHFRLATNVDRRPAGVHIDPCHWTGILYLNPPEQCQGGTDFYRHKASGLEHPPMTPGQLRQSGHESFEAFVNKDSVPNSNNPHAWEHVMHVPMKYNRLVLFRPWFFHDAGQPFGHDTATGRLIYMLFFYSKAELAAQGGAAALQSAAHLAPA